MPCGIGQPKGIEEFYIIWGLSGSNKLFCCSCLKEIISILIKQHGS
jgi:hypothetical protein